MSFQPRSLETWLGLLEARHDKPIQLGLERVRAVLAKLATTTDALVITVGGTNGKGSVCTMLESILLAAGYTVGCYRSPHLHRYNERVCINGHELGDEALALALEEVEQARQDVALTYFEQATLAAWLLFCRQPLDVLILEVGLGGRLDAVNVFEPNCAVVTSVGLDHQGYLGKTREQIGFEKAGIFRPNCGAVCGDPVPPSSLLEHAHRIGAPLWVCGRDFGFSENYYQQWCYWRHEALNHPEAQLRRGGLAHPALRGRHQLCNAATAMTALALLQPRLPVPMQAIRQGLMQLSLPGRFQLLPGCPTVVLDVAHNRQAFEVLAQNLSAMRFHSVSRAVCGMLADKDVEAVAAVLGKRIDHWLLASLPGPRGLSAAALAQRLRAAGVDQPIDCFDSPLEAFTAVRNCAGENDRILVFGSFLTVAEVLAAAEVAVR